MNLNWKAEYLGNSVADYTAALGVFLLLWIVFWVAQKVILRRLKKMAERTNNDIDDTAVELVDRIRPPFYFTVALFIGIKTLALSALVNQIMNGLITVIIVYQIIKSVEILVDFAVRKRLSDHDDKNQEAAAAIINKIVAFVLWSVGILFVLSNFGINVTSLIASLGIGGIAVALAAQNILGDLFSSLAIYFDRPFQIGDFIVAQGSSGTVKDIGIKTTRLQSIDGEEIVIPNQELTKAKIQNFKRMEKRRVAFELGVTYGTAQEKLKEIPDIIANIISAQEEAEFGRAHFKTFADSALVFEIVYHVESKEYETYMNIQQNINLALAAEFSAQGIEFAFPTQTIHLEKS